MPPDDSDHQEELRRYVAGLDQLSRMLRWPTSMDRPVPDMGDATPEAVDDAELEAEDVDLNNELES